MKSSEIAKLAGVSVRTLRHYHAIGLLPEPPRGENGYRDYSAGDLARLLRIKRLASLGFPLARIGDVLDEIDAGLQNADDLRGGTALDELDRELACQIDRLQEQRRTIALLKQQELDPDLPAHLARTAKILLDDERVALPANAGDREALLIVGHLFSEEDAANVEQVMAALDENGTLGQLAESQAWFDALDPRTPREDIDRIVEEAIPCFDPLIDYFDQVDWADWDGKYDAQAEALTDEVIRRHLNEAQAYAQDRLEEALKQRVMKKRNTALDPDAAS